MFAVGEYHAAHRDRAFCELLWGESFHRTVKIPCSGTPSPGVSR